MFEWIWSKAVFGIMKNKHFILNYIVVFFVRKRDSHAKNADQICKHFEQI